MWEGKRDWRDWLANLLGLRPDDRDTFMNLLQKLRDTRHFLSEQEMQMIEGVLKMRDIKVRDVMIPQGDVIYMNIGDDYRQAVAKIREWEHSRYPVFDDESVKGILLAKDLLGYIDRPDAFSMESIMRPALFEPTTRPLDSLLGDLLSQRSHMVVVVDEYGMPAGIVTIEDLLECIVGEIEDETDDIGERTAVLLPGNGGYKIKGAMSVEEFNTHFKAKLPTGAADNIAGWLSAELGHIPQTHATYRKHGFLFKIQHADKRRIHTLLIQPDPDDTPAE